MIENDKILLKNILPAHAVNDINEFVDHYESRCILPMEDYLYVMCRFAGHLDNLQEKLWSQTTLTDSEQSVTDRFNQILQKLQPYSCEKVYRIYANSGHLKESQLIFFKNNEGKVFELQTYLGTSARQWEDEDDYVWEIQLCSPSSNRSLRHEDLGIPSGRDTEEEIIFPSRTKFKIKGVKKNTVLMEETNEAVSCIFPTN